jgi:hypothetical protein
MFTRQDLGVRATIADLEAVKTYVENTKVVLEPVMTLGPNVDVSLIEFLLFGRYGRYQEGEKVLENYRSGKGIYESQQARLGIARNAVFPAVSFDVLVDQVNSFYRDMSAQLLPPVGNHRAVERLSVNVAEDS